MTFALEHPVAWLRGLLPSSDCKAGDMPCGLGHAAKRKCKAPYNQSPEKKGFGAPFSLGHSTCWCVTPPFRVPAPTLLSRWPALLPSPDGWGRETEASSKENEVFRFISKPVRPTRRLEWGLGWVLKNLQTRLPRFGVAWIGGLFTYPLQIQIQSKPLTMEYRTNWSSPSPRGEKKERFQPALARFVVFATMIECCWFVQGGPKRCLCSC